MAAPFATRAPVRPNPPLAVRAASIPSVPTPPRTGLEPIVRSIPPRSRTKEEDLKGELGVTPTVISRPPADELPTPEALQQSVASGARFIIQHLPPLEATLPSLPAKPAPSADASDELPDLAAAAVCLENAPDPAVKPHVSFSCLIAMAILDSPAQKLAVSEIYDWIKARFPYFGTTAAGLGWKNSVRHNLSLNRMFVKKSREEDEVGGKGSHWCIRADCVPVLEAAIVKQAKIYSHVGGGLAHIACGGSASTEAAERRSSLTFRPAPVPPPGPAPHGAGARRVPRRIPMDLSSADAAAALIALTGATPLPAVRGRSLSRPRNMLMRHAGAHSASVRYYPDATRVRPGSEALSATFGPGTLGPAVLAVARIGNPRETAEADGYVSPMAGAHPTSDEGIGVTPELSPRKRSSSGHMLYTFSAPMSVPEGSVRHVPDGRRSPPHARRRLALRETLEEEAAVAVTADDTLSAGAALLTLAGMVPISDDVVVSNDRQPMPTSAVI